MSQRRWRKIHRQFWAFLYLFGFEFRKFRWNLMFSIKLLDFMDRLVFGFSIMFLKSAHNKTTIVRRRLRSVRVEHANAVKPRQTGSLDTLDKDQPVPSINRQFWQWTKMSNFVPESVSTNPRFPAGFCRGQTPPVERDSMRFDCNVQIIYCTASFLRLSITFLI